MNKDLKHSIFEETDCLSEQMLFDYIDKKLSPKENHAVEKHLLSCELCSDALEGLQITKDRKRIAAINQQVNERIAVVAGKEVATKLVRFNYKIVVSIAASLLLLVGGIFFFNMLNKQKEIAQVKPTSAMDESAPPPPVPVLSEETEPQQEAVDEADQIIEPKNEAEKKEANTADSYLARTQQQVQSKTDVPGTDKTIADEMSSATSALSPQKPKDRKNQENIEEGGIADYKKDESHNVSKSAAMPYASDISQAAGAVVADYQSDDLVLENVAAEKSSKKQRAANKNSVMRAERAKEAESPAPIVYEDSDVQTVSQKEKVTTAQTAISGTNALTQEAQFPTGKDSLMRFIRKNFSAAVVSQHQAELRQAIEAEFTVAKSGAVKNITIITATTPEVEQELYRVLQLMPKWSPTIVNGEAVSKKIRLPIKVVE